MPAERNMTDSERSPSRKPRPVWIWLVGALAAALVAFVIVPQIRFGLRFRESALRGMTPAEVLARCGTPPFASTSGPSANELEPVPGEPVWERIGEGGRATLFARPEFIFGYPSFFGDRVAVRFQNGRVVRVTNTPK